MRINNTGVGIGTTAPAAQLDVNAGTIRYGTTYSSASPPVTCSATVDGLTFLSSTYHLCVCKSPTPAYVLVSRRLDGLLVNDPVINLLRDMDKKLDRALEQSARNAVDLAWVKRIIAGSGVVIAGALTHLLRKVGIG